MTETESVQRERLRHLALEGVLLRLARARDREAFALRGGMRMRQLVRTRSALDVDLVCLGASESDVRERLRSVLATPVEDRVRFGERMRVDAMFVRGQHAGYRCIVRARVDEARCDVMIDVRTDLSPRVRPVLEELRLERGQGAIMLFRPETILGRKLQVLAEAGPARWRCKDLLDVHRLVAMQLDADAVAESIDEAFAGSAESATPLLAPSWWSDPRARIRWRQTREPLDAAVASLRSLRGWIEGAP